MMGHYLVNRYELFVSQYAVWLLRGCVVPLYDSLGPNAVRWVL